MLEAQAPAKQTAGVTIDTLSSRLSSATLLEDRRAAIHGLRAFAKDYPASVASGALRPLIACLANDVDDIDTVKPVLETLLGLFNPSPQSPEASEDIALWLADEFTQRQDNIKILLDLLDTADLYSRVYSLRLLTCIFTSRPERTQECILSEPSGTSRIAATLEDTRDAVRNAGVELLRELVQSSTNIQKLVAFEKGFDRVFDVIRQEGSLSQGGNVVQDCLELLANLVRHNPSNQSDFRESGGVSQLAQLLQEVHQKEAKEGGEESWSSPQKDKNIWGLLSIIRLFLSEGGLGTQDNQASFFKHGLLQQVLGLVFSDAADGPIKAEALYTCADMVRGNPGIQTSFAGLQVAPLVHHGAPQTNGQTNGVHKIYIIEALLDVVIAAPAETPFELRMAACECIKAYYYKHTMIRHHFLNRAIEGHMSGEDETANVLSTLLRDDLKTGDPYRVWFAADLVFHLIWEDAEAKSLLIKVSEGDASNGEEVITCIQSIAEMLIAGIQKEEDERVLIGYFTVLCGWLFEDAEAVNDFLGEGSNVQVLTQTMATSGQENTLVKGLCAVLLGIIYEYSTKDSPVPRSKIKPILTAGLGRERYLLALTQLRQHPLVRDFEVVSPGSAPAAPDHELPPYAFFDATFIDFLKDNFSRLSRAIDRDPGIEARIPTREEGIDRDLVDSLRAQLDDKVQALQKIETERLNLERRLDHDQAAYRKEQETSSAEVIKMKQINEALQKEHALEVQRLEQTHTTAYKSLESTTSQQIEELKKQVDSVKKAAADEAGRTKEYFERTINQLRNAKTGLDTRLAEATRNVESSGQEVLKVQKTLQESQGELEAAKTKIQELDKSVKEREQQITELRATETQLRESLEDEKTKVTMLEKEVSEFDSTLKDHKAKIKAGEKALKEKEEARSAVQTELDDFMMILSDLEEKRVRDKKRLKELGETVSDGEDDDEGEEDEEEDEDE
ncbi:hypothetical protein BLS_006246 [Venturia inaequalis]|uniref:Uncharacterized protein n=1 Tax=Venturia inaequalis TaxID=5025 RepID=A0A8H3VLG8_VENIN|nr:hypothetical protein BLS_006246 [Venturia inaequalis]KAE9991010.1 hypothetical protein EG327_000611 [Venturia inaequalis]